MILLSYLDTLFSFEGFVLLFMLTIMEIILGIDNIIFISILTERLHKHDQRKARIIGLTLALLMRIILLIFVSWIVGFKEPLFSVEISKFSTHVSVRDLILLGGGMFLIYKSTSEIHEKLEGDDDEANAGKKKISLMAAVIQIVLLDIVFSFDSILTAVGMVDQPDRDVVIMIVAVVISMACMLWYAKAISDFINAHPTIKMLALSFLLLIGVLLVAEAFHKEIPKGYIYFAMTFSLVVEFLNLRSRKAARIERLQKRKERIRQQQSDMNNKSSEHHQHS